MEIKSTKTLTTINKTPSLIETSRRLFLAIAEQEQTEKVVLDYQTKILKEGQWKAPKNFDGDIILYPKDAWTINDKDFKIYDNKCQAKAKENGYEIEQGQCPLLLANSKVNDLKNDLIDEFEPFVGIKRDYLFRNEMEDYNKYVNFLIEIMSTSIGEEK